MTKQAVNIRRTKESLNITVNQTISVQNIDLIYNKLKTTNFDRDNIVFILPDNYDTDFAFIQLLISFQRSKLTESQKITLKAPLNDGKKNVILNEIKEFQFATI